MKIIGITGGVGAGKSTVLNMLKDICSCRIIMADDEAKKLMQRGEALEKDAVRLFGPDAYQKDGSLNTRHIAEVFYKDASKLAEWNGLVHPAVNAHIYQMIADAKTDEGLDFVFVEAALLIENNYDEICDEIWYIYAPEEVRKKRLGEDRGYTEEKSTGIMAKQMKDEDFRRHCSFVIDTTEKPSDTRLRLKNKLEEYR